MKTTTTAGKVGKVMVALVAGVLMPVMIWIALGVALQQKAAEQKSAKQAAAPTLGEILAAAK